MFLLKRGGRYRDGLVIGLEEDSEIKIPRKKRMFPVESQICIK